MALGGSVEDDSGEGGFGEGGFGEGGFVGERRR